MRKSIYILILILFASTCFAGGVTDKVKAVIARKNAAPAGGTITVCTGSTGGTSNYTVGYPGHSPSFTPGAVTLTSLSAQLSAVGTATTCWIALYADVPTGGDYTYDRLAYGSFVPAIGWNLAAINYSASAGVSYYITYGCDGTVTRNTFTDGNDSGYIATAWNATPIIGYSSGSVTGTTVCFQVKAGY